jgi:hypothetical protein
MPDSIFLYYYPSFFCFYDKLYSLSPAGTDGQKNLAAEKSIHLHLHFSANKFFCLNSIPVGSRSGRAKIFCGEICTDLVAV